MSAPEGSLQRTPHVPKDEASGVDRTFNGLTLASGLVVLVLLGLVGLFLLLRSRDAIGTVGVWDFLTTERWRTDVSPPEVGVLGMVTGTVIVALIAVTIAVPFGATAALYITQYADLRWRRYLTALVDLLAAVPSLLFGLWGFIFLAPQMVPFLRWMSQNLSFIPIFKTEEDALYVGTMFTAGLVVSLMTLPIVASIAREVFAQTPPGEKEAALALGGTRWGMIRTVVLPFGKGGMIGASMLGLGRALGETIAVALLLPQVPEISVRVLENGGATISGFIARRAGSDAFTTSGLMGAGLVLFVLTLTTNMLASIVVSRSRSGAGVEI